VAGRGDPESRPAIGEPLEFRDLFRRFHRRVLGFFARKGLSPEDALDLTQETFLGIYRGLEGFRHEARIETWIYKVATAVYLKRLRAASTVKRTGHQVAYDESAAEIATDRSSAGQLEGVLLDEKRLAIRQAIDRLPDQMRRCLTLRIYQDLTYREIAVVMRLKLDTVKAHLFQARRKLRDDLSRWDLDF